MEAKTLTEIDMENIASMKSTIARLEVDKARLVEALGTTNVALILAANDLSSCGGFAGIETYKLAENNRALLAEMEKSND